MHPDQPIPFSLVDLDAPIPFVPWHPSYSAPADRSLFLPKDRTSVQRESGAEEPRVWPKGREA